MILAISPYPGCTLGRARITGLGISAVSLQRSRELMSQPAEELHIIREDLGPKAFAHLSPDRDLKAFKVVTCRVSR